jgi:hypothetical protein
MSKSASYFLFFLPTNRLGENLLYYPVIGRYMVILLTAGIRIIDGSDS